MDHKPAPQEPGQLTLRWSHVGIAGLVLGVASLGVLVTVVTLQSIDALSTVALVLAVLAFVIQIIIFVAQTATASAQAVEVQAVNAETKALLAEVRTNTAQTLETLRGQFDRVIDNALGQVRDVAVSESSNSDDQDGGGRADDSLAEYRERVLQEIEEAADKARGQISYLGLGGVSHPTGRDVPANQASISSPLNTLLGRNRDSSLSSTPAYDETFLREFNAKSKDAGLSQDSSALMLSHLMDPRIIAGRNVVIAPLPSFSANYDELKAAGWLIGPNRDGKYHLAQSVRELVKQHRRRD